MNQFAALDISTLIWDIAHYTANKPEYYNLMSALPNIYEGILVNNIPVLIRGQLGLEIQTYFPYDVIPSEHYAFQMSTLYFLSNARLFDYPTIDDTAILSTPDLVKNYYSLNTMLEIRYLITHLYSNRMESQKMLSFSIVWNSKKNLILKNSHLVEIETLLCDNLEQHAAIISGFKKLFEHHAKHDDYKSSKKQYYGEIISPLSCYNERLDDKKEAQNLLDGAQEYKGAFYNYDKKNKTYVKFFHTRANIYHGFDIELSSDDLINLQKTFNK